MKNNSKSEITSQVHVAEREHHNLLETVSTLMSKWERLDDANYNRNRSRENTFDSVIDKFESIKKLRYSKYDPDKGRYNTLKRQEVLQDDIVALKQIAKCFEHMVAVASIERDVLYNSHSDLYALSKNL